MVTLLMLGNFLKINIKATVFILYDILYLALIFQEVQNVTYYEK